MITPLPSRTDPTVRRASNVAGGPRGRYARDSRWWTPIRVILAIAAFTLALAYAQKSPCANGQWVDSLQYTKACYSDVVPLWSAEGLADGAVPYRDHAVEYPVVTGGFMWITAELTHGWHALNQHGVVPGSNDVLVFDAFTCLLLAFCGLIAVRATAGAAGPRRRWDAAIFAASPLLVFHAFSNWDLLAMAFLAGAMWAWARNRPIATGVLIGLGTAAKLYPALMIFPLAILAYRTRRWRPVGWTAVTAGVIWLVVNLPVALSWTKGWWEFYSFSETRPAEASTFWAMLNHFYPSVFGGSGSTGWQPPGIAVALALIVALAIIAALAHIAPQRPRLAQLMFLTVAAFLLTTKVWSPQYSVWLVPLLALARPKWRLAIIWQFTEIAVWIGTLLWLLSTANPNKALTYEGLTWLLLIRDGTLLVLMGCVVREMLYPETDPVRTPDDPDPGGGIFCEVPADDRRRPEHRGPAIAAEIDEPV